MCIYICIYIYDIYIYNDVFRRAIDTQLLSDPFTVASLLRHSWMRIHWARLCRFQATR